jgi:hypothetical protein
MFFMFPPQTKFQHIQPWIKKWGIPYLGELREIMLLLARTSVTLQENILNCYLLNNFYVSLTLTRERTMLLIRKTYWEPFLKPEVLLQFSSIVFMFKKPSRYISDLQSTDRKQGRKCDPLAKAKQTVTKNL